MVGSGGPIAPLCTSAAPCPGRADLSGYGNAKSLVETRLFGRLHINSQILVAGACYTNYMQIEIEPFPLSEIAYGSNERP